MSSRSARHVGIGIACSPREVYAFVSDPTNIAQWAHGLSAGLKPAGDRWVGDGPSGRISVTFAPPNAFGIVDHHVTLPSGAVVYVPFRVLPSGPRGCDAPASEVVLTVFREGGMTDARFAEDVAAVEKDLAKLKALLEDASPTDPDEDVPATAR